jgi:hypothetical protein
LHTPSAGIYLSDWNGKREDACDEDEYETCGADSSAIRPKAKSYDSNGVSPDLEPSSKSAPVSRSLADFLKTLDARRIDDSDHKLNFGHLRGAVSNVWRNIPFVPIAQRWVPGKYSGALLNFSDCLQYLAWVFSTTRFENIPAHLFYDLRRLDEETVKRGREQAIKAGWIGCESGLRRTFTYWFLVNGRPLAEIISKLPPPTDGKPRIILQERWVYQADLWAKHLAKGNARQPANCRRLETSDLRQKTDRNESTSGKNQVCQRQNADSHSQQPVDKAILAANALPLKNSLKNKDSEGVAGASTSERVASEGKARTRPTRGCISPSWDAVGAVNGGAQGKRSGAEFLEHVALDPVVQLLAKKLNAKIVDVIDLREPGAHEKVPGTRYEKWVQPKVSGR